MALEGNPNLADRGPGSAFALDHPPGAGHTVTLALHRLRDGGAAARADLVAAVYDVLLHAAARTKARWTVNWLETGDIAHRTILRVLAQQKCEWRNRAHFFAVVAETMRHVVHDLVDHERAGKRGGGGTKTALDDVDAPAPGDVERLAMLEEALERLEARDPRMAKVVVMRCYGGFDLDEIAAALGTARRTVDRLWQFAKAWLQHEMSESAVAE